MSYIEFPRKLQREASNSWNIVGNTQVSGQTDGASVDIRSDGGGRWIAELKDIQLWDQGDPLLWRALRQNVKGGVVAMIVYRLDQGAPWPLGYPFDYGDIPHSDGALFSDGSGYGEPVIDVIATNAAALRATALRLTLVNCGAFQGGEAFSIQHVTFGWRTYEIATVVVVDGAHVDITFEPPLREAVASGQSIEFDHPRCVMKLANASAMDLDLTVLPYTTVSVKFVESKFQ